MKKSLLLVVVILALLSISACKDLEKEALNSQSTNYLVTERNITIPTEGGSLGATLTLPTGYNGSMKAVVIVPGSGNLDRDGNIPNSTVKWNIFKQIANYISSQGNIVLRYDKRGVGESAQLSKNNKITFSSLKYDTESCIKYLTTLEEVDEIFLMGHSEGTLFATLAAKKTRMFQDLF